MDSKNTNSEANDSETTCETQNMDISSNDVFKTLNEQFHKIKCIQKSDKICTETEPVWNASEAKLLIDTMLSNLQNIINNIGATHPNYFRFFGMKCAIIYEKAKILLHLGDQENAQEALAEALCFLEKHVLKPEITFLALRIANHYSFLQSKQDDLSKPQALLEQAEQIYRNVKSQTTCEGFYTADDLFFPEVTLTPKKETNEKVERLVTNNFQMLAYIYNKQGQYDRFAALHHVVLSRQLEMREGDPTLWAMKAARLAGYFLSKSRLKEARHHLAVAYHILETYEVELKSMDSSEVSAVRWEELQRRTADVAKCWVKYGLFLFSVSKTHLVSQFYGEPNDFLTNLWVPPSFDTFPSSDQTEETGNSPNWGQGEGVAPAFPTDSTGGEMKAAPDTPDEKEHGQSAGQPATGTSDNMHILLAKPGSKDAEPNDGPPGGDTEQEVQAASQELRFPGVDVSGIECQVSASLVETTEQARTLFLFTHTWLKRAKMFYTLRDHAMEYVNSILDLSELYRYLAFYEEDIESQYAVQKRRADALETLSSVLREVRPHFYHNVSVELLRELAEVQLEMLGLNLRRLYVSPEEAEEGLDASEQDSSAQAQQQQYVQGADRMLHKMEALADIHSKLEQFGDSLNQGTTLGETVVSGTAEMTGDGLPYFI